MSEYKIQNDIKNLIKMGLSYDMANLVAHANNGRSQDAQHVVNCMVDEQELLGMELQNFTPFPKNEFIVLSSQINLNNNAINIDDTSKENEKSDLQHK